MAQENNTSDDTRIPRSSALRSTRKKRNVAIKIDWDNLGHDVKIRRNEIGLTIRDVEKITGISHSTIIRLENGHSRWAVRAETYLTLAIAIGMNPLSYARVDGDSNLHKMPRHNAEILKTLHR
jgi:transcriptional regulator with XRE-family HTH domain